MNGVVTISSIEGTAPVERKRLIHPESVNHVSFSVDSRSIATAGDDGLVRVWEVAGQPVETRKPTETFRHKASVKLVAFGAGGLLASTGDDGPIRVWQTASGGQPARTAVVATIANEEPLSSLGNFAVLEFPHPAASANAVPFNTAVIAATGYNDWIKMWAAPFRRPKIIGTTSPTSLECARYASDDLTALWERPNTGASIGPTPFNETPRSIVSCNHVVGLYNGVSRVWDMSESFDAGPMMTERARFIHGGSALAASIREGFAVVGDSTGVARIWKFESNRPGAGTERNSWADVSADGRRAVSLENERIAWHDLVTGKMTFLPPGAPPSDPIDGVTFDRAGGRLAIKDQGTDPRPRSCTRFHRERPAANGGTDAVRG